MRKDILELLNPPNFSDSTFANKQVYHGSDRIIDSFDLSKSNQIGLHCGSYTQAYNRIQGDGYIYQIDLEPSFNCLRLPHDAVYTFGSLEFLKLLSDIGLVPEDAYSMVRRDIQLSYPDIFRSNATAKEQMYSNYYKDLLNAIGCQAIEYYNTNSSEGQGNSIIILDDNIIEGDWNMVYDSHSQHKSSHDDVVTYQINTQDSAIKSAEDLQSLVDEFDNWAYSLNLDIVISAKLLNKPFIMISLTGKFEDVKQFLQSSEFKNWSGWDDSTIEEDVANLKHRYLQDTTIQSSRDDRYYFGQDAAEKYGDLIIENLSGTKISKRSDLAEEPGGLIYEANQLGIDMWDLLEALEGLCYQGKAREIDDSTYLVLADVDSCWNAVYSAEEVCEDYAEFVGGPYDGQWIAYEDVVELPEFNGYNTNRSQRPELWNWPKIKGYTTAMWDGDHVRYESWDVYDALSR